MLKNQTNNSRLMKNDRSRKRNVVIVAGVLSLFASWTLLAYSGALDPMFRHKGGNAARIVVQSFNSNSPSKEYIYGGGRLIATEEPAGCSFSISPISQSFTSSAGTGSVSVTAGAGCAWAATSNATWITITAGSTGAGNGTVSYSVAANSGATRTGTVTIAGQSFTVSQAAASCTYSISPTSQSFTSSGGTGSVSVTAGAGCAWAATSNATWITITTGSSGTGNGTVSYSVAANGGAARTGTMTIAGQTFTVSQAAASCTYSISPTSQSFTSTGGTGSVNVTAGAGCAWTATSNATWITITAGSSGAGNGTVSYSVAANSGPARSGTLTIAGQSFTVSQSSGCTYAISPTSQSFTSSAATGSVNVTSSAGCAWTATSNAAWITITAGSSGAGNGTVSYSVAANSGAARTGTITIAGQTFTVTQAAAAGGVPNAPSGLTAFAVSPNQINLQWTDNSTNESGFKILLMGGNGSFVLDTVAANVTTYSDMTVNPCSQTCYQIKAFNASGDSAGSNQACAFTQGCETTATDAQSSDTPGRDTSIAHRFLTWANELSGLSVVVHAATSANEAQEPNTLPSNNASLFLFGLAGFCLLLLILTGYEAAVRVATDVLSRTRRWRVRILVSLIIIALALPVSPQQAQFAAGEAGRFLDASVARLRDVLKRGPATKQISTQSFDPSGQSSLVHHFKLCPRKLLLYPGENFTLVPLALDRDKEVVEGAAFEWQSKNADVAGVSSTGEVIAISPGHTQVEVSAGSAKGKVNVEVRAGSRPAYTDRKKADDDWEAEHGHDCDGPEDDPAPSQGIDKREAERNLGVSSGISSRDDSGNEASTIKAHSVERTPARERLVSAGTASVKRSSFRTAHAAMLRGFREPAPVSLLGHTGLTEPAEAQPVVAGPSPQNGNGGLLDGSSPDVASIAAAAPFNAVGQPRFAPMEFSQGSAAKTRNNLGSYNYSFSAPVLGLGGRGIGVNLALTYNSRVWNKDNANTMTFNYQKGWPAPGWTLGYGRLIDNYDNTGSGDLSGVGQANAPGSYLLIQPDGTRIHLQQTYDSASGRWSHNSKDGSFITFNPLNGKLRYTDGTLVTFDLINNRRLPSSIRTNNGDTITIAYKTFVKNNPDPSLNFPFRWAIDYIYDSLGRYVRFNYDSTPRLVSITAKDKGGATDRVLCQIDYTDIALSYNFSGSITTVNAPASNSLITVVRRIYWPATGRGYLFPDYNSYGMARKVSMRIGMTASGDGTEAAYTRYDYPSVGTQVGALNDSPQFTHRYEWWQNKIDGAAETMYAYSRSTDAVAGTEIDKVSYPNGIDMVTTSGNDQTGDPGDFGHVVKTEMKVGTNPPLRTTQQSYTTDSSGGQQIAQVTATDEAGNIAKTTYDYYASYGRVQNVNEYGFSSAVQRKTTFFYSDNAGLLGLNMTGVVTEVRVFNGAGGLVAKTVNEIDNYTVNTLMDYSVTAPNHDYSGFGVTGTSRGNITKVTMSVLPGASTISRGFKYDVFGNVVRADVSCCQTKTTAFSSSTWFSQPDSVTDGDPLQAPHLTTSFSYDFSTGLALSTTDPNGQATSFDYDSAWRVKTVNSATGASTLTQFDKDSNQNDLLSYFQRVTYLEADGITTRTITSRSWFDGAGRVLRAGTAAGASPTSYDAVKTEYDSMGRVSRQSNPYTGDVNGNGSPAFWTSNTYDSQSRVTTVTLPDTQTIQTEYNGAIVTVTDQVTRKRQSQVDGLGRLISVTEQDPATGVLSLATTYSYDTLDNLTGVDQGGQTRSFAYDSLGRMTSQSTPEGGAMSFAYTDFDAVLKRTDARNVETHYHYDALNRPNQVWYTGVGGSDDPTASRPALPAGVAATSDVIIAYNTAAPGNGSVNRIDDGGGFETYVYDSLGRNTSKTRTIDGVNSYQTQYQYNQTNQLAVMIYPSGKRVRMNFDSRGRMIGEDKVDTTGSLLTSYVSGIGYNVAGQVTSMTSGSGVTESYTYSANRLQLTRQTAVKGAATLMDLNYNYAAAAGASGAGTTAGNSGQLMAIGNNPSSQPSTINGQNRTQSFSYDDLGRLVSSSSWGISQRSYSYDRWGNRTGMTDSIMGASQSISLQPQAGAPTGVTSNRIASVTNNGVMSSYVYDAAGNLTNDGAHSYQYDAENRIAKVDAGTSNEAGYCYDANNWRVKKVAGGFTTYYVWEGALVIAEYSNAPVGSGGTSYYVPDPLSTRMITDSSGALKGTQDHLPFGEDGGTTGTSERHRFTNYERDSESATDYAVNRQYAAGISRFMQLDPIEGSIDYPQSLNKFGYALNDPVNYTDPLGLKCAWVWVPWKVCSVFDGKEHCRSGGDWENICSNDFEIRITGGCDRPSPDRDISAVGGMLNIASTAATVGQYSNVNPRTGAWKGFTKQGPKWFRSGFPGNQYVSRSAALSYAKGFNVLGRAAGLLGAGLSFYQMSNAFSQGRNAEGRKFALDGGMGLVGTLGGPYGAAAATVYFGVDMTVGWPYVGHQLMLTRCGADCQYRLNHCTFANK